MNHFFIFKISKKISEEKKNILSEDGIREFILKNHCVILIKNNNSLIFKKEFQFFPTGAFKLIEKGEFSIVENKLIFRFSCLRRLIFALIASLLPMIQTHDIKISAFFFLVIGGGNLLVAFIKSKMILDSLLENKI
jgi:hypothetical protein